MPLFNFALRFKWQRAVLACAVGLRRAQPLLYAVLSLPAILILAVLSVYPIAVLQSGFGMDGLLATLLTAPWTLLVFAVIVPLGAMTAERLWQVTGISALLGFRNNSVVDRDAGLAGVVR